MTPDIFSVLWLLLKSSSIGFIILLFLFIGFYLYIRTVKPMPDMVHHSISPTTVSCLLTGYAFSLLLSALYVIHNLGWSIEPDVLSIYSFSQNPISMLLLSMNQILGFLIGVIFTILLNKGGSLNIGLCRPAGKIWITLAIIVFGLSIILLSSYVNNLLLSLDDDIVVLRFELHGNLSYNLKYFHLFYIIVLAPIVIELFFRGVLYELFGYYISHNYAIFLQAILFAAMYNNIEMFVFYVVFGIVMGYSRYLSKSLIPAIFIHMLFSSISVVDLWT